MAETNVVFVRDGDDDKQDNKASSNDNADGIRIRVADDADGGNADHRARDDDRQDDRATFGAGSKHEGDEGKIPDKIRQQVEEANRKAAKAAADTRAALQTAHEKDLETLKYQQAFAASESKLVDAQIKEARGEMARAEEDGDTNKKLELEDKVAELRNKKQKLEGSAGEVRRRIEEKEKSPPSTASRTLSPDERRASVEWAEKNSWFNNPVTKEDYDKRALVLNIDDVLLKGNYDPSSPDYYQEVDKRLEAAMPRNNNNNTTDDKDDKGARNPGTRPPVSPRAAGPAGKGQNEVTLTKEDFDTMRVLHLNPNDKKIQERFAREKIKTERRFRDSYDIRA